MVIVSSQARVRFLYQQAQNFHLETLVEYERPKNSLSSSRSKIIFGSLFCSYIDIPSENLFCLIACWSVAGSNDRLV